MNAFADRNRVAVPTPPRTAMAWPGAMLSQTWPALSALRRWRGLWPALIVLLTVLAVAWARHRDGSLGPLAVPGAVLATAPLLAARRWPFPALTVVLAVNSSYLMLARLSWPLTGVIAWLIALACCPLWLKRSQALALLILVECAVLAAVFVPASVNPTPWDAHIAEALAALVAWGIGENVRARRLIAVDRAASQERMLGLLELDAAARGRAGLARDLHDIVAHHVSLIAVRAATAPYQSPDTCTPAMREAFEDIASEARAALEELRTVLGVLRSPDGEPLRTPHPSLADLPDLLDRMRAAGLPVTFDSRLTPGQLPESIELCCYRVIQEAVTNAGRHTPGCTVTVSLEFDQNTVDLLVVSEGGVANHPAGGAPGFGLIGMRERVVGLGGQFAAGEEGAAFVVSARLPRVAASERSA